MMYKTCVRCKKDLPTTDFYKQAKTKDGLSCYCKKCSYEINKKYQHEHPEKIREYNRKSWNKCREAKRKYETIRVDKRHDFLDTLKTPCVKCGETRVWCIEFHHKDPNEKSFGIGTCFHKSKEDVIAEVKKTVCLCANCHKEFHHFYGIKPLNPVKDLEEYLNKTGVTEDELI